MKYLLLILLVCLVGCATPKIDNVWKMTGWEIIGDFGEIRYKNENGDILVREYNSYTGATKYMYIYSSKKDVMIYPISDGKKDFEGLLK